MNGLTEQLLETAKTIERLYENGKIEIGAYTILSDRNKQAINYSQCCTPLKEIEERNFMLWLELNEYKIVKATYITKYGHLVDREFLWQKYVEEN